MMPAGNANRFSVTLNADGTFLYNYGALVTCDGLAGYSTGGRPPYGFRRWLVRGGGAAVRQLAEGEYVQMAGHHVVWLPGPEEELAVIRRILEHLALETDPPAVAAARPPPQGELSFA